MTETELSSATFETSRISAYDQLLAHTGKNCTPSQDSVDRFRAADVVLVSGQIVGAGKSTIIQFLESSGRRNVASWTNRELRPGEVEGIDKCQRSLEEMAAEAKCGGFLELIEVREGVFYATPAEFSSGEKYAKDLELEGAMDLRSLAPELPIIVPLPPLRSVDQLRVTEWERRVILREGLDRNYSDKAADDLRNRLLGVVTEADRIIELNLLDDPNILFVVNDDLDVALAEVHGFLDAGKSSNQQTIGQHIVDLRDFAQAALSV